MENNPVDQEFEQLIGLYFSGWFKVEIDRLVMGILHQAGPVPLPAYLDYDPIGCFLSLIVDTAEL